MTDTELIERAKCGDGVAIRSLYDRYSSRVYSVVRRLTGDDALAEDCAQEAWLRAIRALPTFRGDAAFGTWMHRIAINSALMSRRARLRVVEREAPLPETLPGASRNGDALLKARLERAMEQLPDGMRAVLVLHDVEGYTHEEIGLELGIAAGTSKSQLFKARARMRELLRPTAPAAAPGETPCSIFL